jgi:hypothetical protein
MRFYRYNGNIAGVDIGQMRSSMPIVEVTLRRTGGKLTGFRVRATFGNG